jgi:hypothetical protein
MDPQAHESLMLARVAIENGHADDALDLLTAAATAARRRGDPDALTVLAVAVEQIGVPGSIEVAARIRSLIPVERPAVPLPSGARRDVERPWRAPNERAAHLGTVGTTRVWFDRIETRDGTRQVDEHVRARVESSGTVTYSGGITRDVTRRPTLTRMALGSILPGTALIPGFAFQKKKVEIYDDRQTHDDRQLYFIVEHPEWSVVEEVNPDDAERVHRVVAALNGAARRAALVTEQPRAALPEAFEADGAGAIGRAPAADPVGQLERLAALRQEGALSDEEFEAAKSRVLGRL